MDRKKAKLSLNQRDKYGPYLQLNDEKVKHLVLLNQ